MMNRRQYPRFSFNEPVGYQRERDFPLEGCLAADISQTGLRICVNHFIPLNSVIELQIRLPGRIQVIPVRATVVWVQEMPYRDDSWELGLHLESDESSTRAIRSYVYLRQEESV